MTASKLIVILVCLIIGGAVSCSPNKRLQRKLKRADAFAQKHGLTMIDTITIIDSITVPQYVHDTTTKIVFNDSVTVINNDTVRLIYHYDTLTQTIMHEVECKEQTIVKEITIPVERTHSETVPSWMKWLVIGLSVALIAIILRVITK